MKIPDVPPTWELVFQIQEPFFGMEPRGDIRSRAYGSDAEKRDALWHYDFEVYERCVEELGWAAIPGSYNPGGGRFLDAVRRRYARFRGAAV